jgi:arylsulfatase A-like enzyme
MAALRYLDLSLERFFSRLRSDGSLKDTAVIILGDHGRHEAIGQTDVERQVGHFLAPLYVWLDESLRTQENYRPRVVDPIASQVDIAPTVLALAGFTPPLAPFVGRDMSCLLTADCMRTNQAYLSSVYDEVIGLADTSGIWLYSFRRDELMVVDLDLRRNAERVSTDDKWARERMSTLAGLYLTGNLLLEQNRLWSRGTVPKRPASPMFVQP